MDEPVFITDDGLWYVVGQKGGSWFRKEQGLLLDDREMARLILDVMYGVRPRSPR